MAVERQKFLSPKFLIYCNFSRGFGEYFYTGYGARGR
jgi:hypothetical protein